MMRGRGLRKSTAAASDRRRAEQTPGGIPCPIKPTREWTSGRGLPGTSGSPLEFQNSAELTRTSKGGRGAARCSSDTDHVHYLVGFIGHGFPPGVCPQLALRSSRGGSLFRKPPTPHHGAAQLTTVYLETIPRTPRHRPHSHIEQEGVVRDASDEGRTGARNIAASPRAPARISPRVLHPRIPEKFAISAAAIPTTNGLSRRRRVHTIRFRKPSVDG